MKEKVITSLALALILLGGSVRAQESGASEDRFDVLAKSISPILALLTPAGSAGNHALNVQASVSEISGLPPEAAGASVHVVFEFPDKLLIQFPTPAGLATICRDGQSVWAYPAALFSPLVEKVGAEISTKPLPPFEIDAQKAVLLPALLDVHDAGSVKFGDQDYRVLDVRLITLGKKKQAAGWPVRLWIHASDHRVAQVALHSKDWKAMLTIQQLELAPALPPSTWQPTPEQHDQVIAVPGEKIAALLQLALKQKK